MALFDRILLCYDGTPEGRAALRSGALLARELNAKTHLMAVIDHAYWARGFEILSPVAFEADDAATQQILTEGVAKLSDLGVAATGHLVTGKAVDEIPKLANELAVDLIVIGHHRDSAFMRWWTGKNHALLLDRVRCGVVFETSAGHA